jgi:hypothetical protein
MTGTSIETANQKSLLYLLPTYSSSQQVPTGLSGILQDETDSTSSSHDPDPANPAQGGKEC